VFAGVEKTRSDFVLYDFVSVLLDQSEPFVLLNGLTEFAAK